MKWPIFPYLIVLSVGLLGGGNAAAQTRFQAFNVNFPDPFPLADNKVGIRYWGASFGATSTAEPGLSVATDGRALLLFDPPEFEGRLAALNEPTVPSKETEIRFPFVGSGIDVLYLDDAIGEVFEWEIVDSGSNDNFNVVASGSVDTNHGGAFGTYNRQTATLAAQGTLPTDRIHMLRLKATDTDGLGGGGNWRVFIDAIDVHDNTPLNYDDDSNVSGNWTYTTPGLWDIGFADNGFFEATRSGTAGPGETVDIDFTGTSFVLSGMEWGDTNFGPNEFRVTGTYNWEIDGGALGSGTINSVLDVSTGVRWPTLQVNGLPSGPHTLTLTNNGSDQSYQGDFNIDNLINNVDFMVWQRGGSPNGATAGDLALWESGFGGTAFSNLGFMIFDTLATFDAGVGPVSESSVAVPEPSTMLLAVSLLVMVIGRPARSSVTAR